ncbi:hypothetical protein ACJIZ3_002782 [Penstemon smallii]|uniref:Uncharacterized protein n=1 Tax=Penstemon smallii TaxID=265156 RepID=A0ABD3U7D4_9LAMI
MKVSSKKLSKIIGKWKRKAHFVVYSKDNKRFHVPLCYLNHPIFRVLLEMAEEEYGFTVHGPLRVPFEKELVEYIFCLLKNKSVDEAQKAVLSIAMNRGATIQDSNRGLMVTPVLSSCG